MAHLREAGFALPSSSADEQSSEQEQLYARLNTLGAHVGANYAERLCASRPPFGSVLEVLKFLCKDLWISLWERQVDNLRTNHRVRTYYHLLRPSSQYPPPLHFPFLSLHRLLAHPRFMEDNRPTCEM